MLVVALIFIVLIVANCFSGAADAYDAAQASSGIVSGILWLCFGAFVLYLLLS